MTVSPPKYFINCPPECSLHPDKIGQPVANALLAFKESGFGVTRFRREAGALLGRELVASSVSRHLLHYRESDPRTDPVVTPDNTKRATDLEILDEIIVAGFRNSKSWKPTIKDTLDAMKLKSQMTGNSAFQDMLDAMDSALDLADDMDAAPEAPEALGTADEAAEEEEPLPEPLIGSD